MVEGIPRRLLLANAQRGVAAGGVLAASGLAPVHLVRVRAKVRARVRVSALGLGLGFDPNP